MTAAIDLLHPAWCDPAHHQDDGAHDQTCTSSVHRLDTVTDLVNDPNHVQVWVEQYQSRDYDPGPHEWEPSPAVVVVEHARENGADLTPTEARQLARQLLMAADIADQ